MVLSSPGLGTLRYGLFFEMMSKSKPATGVGRITGVDGLLRKWDGRIRAEHPADNGQCLADAFGGAACTAMTAPALRGRG